MSRIDDVIARLCPDGVPYMPIGDASVSKQILAGATPSSGRREYWEDGTIPWMSSGEVNKGTVWATEKLITEAAYQATSTKMVPAGAVVIALAGQGKTRGTVARTRLALCTNQSLASIVTSPRMDADFLFYFLRTQYQQLREVSSGDGTRGGLNLQMIRAYRVPVPPMEVQREIVRILDTFTELQAELEAELEARRRQYEHYRREMLSFAASVPRASIGELTDGVSSGSNKVRTEDAAYTVFGSTGPIGTTDRPAHSGPALLVARVGANAGRVYAVAGDYDVSDNTLIVRPRDVWDLRFAYHQLAHLNLNQYAVGGGQPLVTGKLIQNLQVPVLSLTEQKRIAAILDKFDALLNDRSVGLPAELAARRKQYEHYRDRLLWFEEVSA